MTSAIRTVRLPDGDAVSCLGQGTWRMGETPSRRAEEIAAIRRGVELGLTLIDTAEMYADGDAEEMLGEALQGSREEVFIVSKAYPQNGGGARLRQACENSLKRLATDRIDLYLLHWRGNVPLARDCRRYGSAPARRKDPLLGRQQFRHRRPPRARRGGRRRDCATNQILYNLLRRGPEFDLLPGMAARGMPAMAYSPIEQGRLPKSGPLVDIAKRLGATTHQLALAWALLRPDVIAIPKAATTAHVEANRAALDLTFDEETLAALDDAFPPPRRKTPLAMI